MGLVYLRRKWAKNHAQCRRADITQQTGVTKHYGDGAGLFAFDSLDQIPDAVKMINADSGCPCPPEPPHGRRLPRSVNKALPFDLQPILEGELLRLRPLRAEDWGDLYAVASDPLIWEQHPINDRYKEEVFRGFFREALESGGALIVLDSKDDRVIGSSRFHGYDKEKGEIEIGWTFLARSHWGGKYNQEMKRLMLRHAFRFVQSVSFLIGPQNLRSQRAVEKIGAVRVGSSSDGSGRESFVFQITAPP